MALKACFPVPDVYILVQKLQKDCVLELKKLLEEAEDMARNNQAYNHNILRIVENRIGKIFEKKLEELSD